MDGQEQSLPTVAPEGGQPTVEPTPSPSTFDTADSFDWSDGEGGDEGAQVGPTTQGGESREAPTTSGPTYEIDGRTYSADEIREFIRGGMRERDYRTKTMALAQERRALQQIRQAAEAWQTIQQHPELVQALSERITDMLQRGAGGEAPGLGASGWDPSAAPAGEVEPWQVEIQRLRAQMAQMAGEYNQRLQAYNQYAWQNYYAQREAYAKAKLGALLEKYPYAYEDEVVAAFRDHQDADLEELAKASHEHWRKFYTDRQRQMLQKRQANAGARVASTAPGGVPAVAGGKPPQSWDSARRAALQRMKSALGGAAPAR